MAEAISYDHRLRNVKQELYQQLSAAPGKHVEAVLDVYAILQLLHDKGIFEVIKDALGSGERVMEILTDTMEKDEVIRTIRNLTIFVKIIGSIEPDLLEKIMNAVSKEFENTKAKKPPGLLRLLGKLANANGRRVLEPIVTALNVAGKELPQTKKKERTRTTRRSA